MTKVLPGNKEAFFVEGLGSGEDHPGLAGELAQTSPYLRLFQRRLVHVDHGKLENHLGAQDLRRRIRQPLVAVVQGTE